MNEPDLHEILDRAPTAPLALGYGARLATRARQRRTDRRRGVAAAGVAAVAVAAVTVGPTLLPDAPMSPAPAPAPSATTGTSTPAVATDLGCTGRSDRAESGAPVVPEGAVAARLCGGTIDNGGFDMAWPADTLRGDWVQRLVSDVNALDPYVQPEGCDLPYSPPFNLMLAYPDGTVLRLQGDTAGNCEHVTVPGGGEWSGAPALLNRVLGLVDGQRAETRGPDRPVEPATCPESWQDVAYSHGATPVFAGGDVAITACRYLLEQGDPTTITQSWDGSLVTETVVAEVAALLRQVVAGSRSDPCGGVEYDLDRTQDVLLVRDRYGDVQLVSTEPCWPSTATGPRLYPSPALAETVTDLFG